MLDQVDLMSMVLSLIVSVIRCLTNDIYMPNVSKVKDLRRMEIEIFFH